MSQLKLKVQDDTNQEAVLELALNPADLKSCQVQDLVGTDHFVDLRRLGKDTYANKKIFQKLNFIGDYNKLKTNIYPFLDDMDSLEDITNKSLVFEIDDMILFKCALNSIIDILCVIELIDNNQMMQPYLNITIVKGE